MMFVPQSKFCIISIANTVYLPTPLKRSKVAVEGAYLHPFPLYVYTQETHDQKNQTGSKIEKKGNGTYQCPFREHSCSPEAASHMSTVRSSLPLTILLPSGLKHTDVTKSVCPLSCESSLPVATSHMRTVLSSLPLASRVPSGLRRTRPHGHAPFDEERQQAVMT